MIAILWGFIRVEWIGGRVSLLINCLGTLKEVWKAFTDSDSDQLAIPLEGIAHLASL